MLHLIIIMDTNKMLAAAAYVCQSNDGKFDKLALIKTLYFAEKKSICETLNAMTGDRMLKYTHGPVLKNLHDALRDRAAAGFQNEWNKHFKNPSKKDKNVYIKSLPDMDELSFADRAFLDCAITFVNSCPKGELVNTTHDFPEWEAAKMRGSRIIDVSDILKEYRRDLTADEIAEIRKEIQG